MKCVKCNQEFKMEVINGDYGRRTVCPHCGTMYAVVRTAKCTRVYLLDDDPIADPYSKAEDIDDENENWR